MKKVKIFDTTLRDGEQAPGFSLTVPEKIQLAHQLKRLGVDIIEAGFPIASEGDFEAVSLIAKEAQKEAGWPIICGLARCRQQDIARCFEAVQFAPRHRIHIFIASSSIHMEKKLKMEPAKVLKLAAESVKYAKSFCCDVEFSPEDATRAERDFLAEMVRLVIEVGATTVNIPDTVGYSHPEEFADLISYLKHNVPNIGKAVTSVHCHNDLGLAVANSLAAIKAGAEQVEVCLNGAGERAGNAALEEVVMNLKTRKSFYQVETNINTPEIGPASRLLTRLTGVAVQPNKAIVGANAFKHEAGVHQHGVIKERTTYEIMDPKKIGWEGESLEIGKHSGLHGIKKKLTELGFTPDERQIIDIYQKVMALADKKKVIYEEDLVTLAEETFGKNEEKIRLVDVKILTGTKIEPTAIVQLQVNGLESFEVIGHGNGPVDATFKAVQQVIRKFIKKKIELEIYDLTNLTKGTDAFASAFVQLKSGKRLVRGRFVHTDVVLASLGAYLQALNRLLRT
jgi:2-isopropylmalate synthase